MTRKPQRRRVAARRTVRAGVWIACGVLLATAWPWALFIFCAYELYRYHKEG